MKHKKKKATLKPIRFFGISFRNKAHRGYFVLSLIVITICITMSIYSYNRVWLAYGREVFIVNVIGAIIVTRFGQRTTELYSQDCIWWNGLLTVILYLFDICVFRNSGIPH